MLKKLYIPLLIIALSLSLQSCFKVEDTIATITVVNEQGTPIPGAEVTLFNLGSEDDEPRDPIYDQDNSKFTNGSGKATFNFTDDYQAGQSGFAVLEISVQKGSLIGEGIIKIEEQETTEETVTIE
ncbi:MAG: hypothetical protein AB8B53_09535 [Flavobacteriales bacterium]